VDILIQVATIQAAPIQVAIRAVDIPIQVATVQVDIRAVDILMQVAPIQVVTIQEAIMGEDIIRVATVGTAAIGVGGHLGRYMEV
jgi:hypothetical protein